MGILSQAKKMFGAKEKRAKEPKKTVTTPSEEAGSTPAEVTGLAEKIGLEPIVSEKSMTQQAAASTAMFRVRSEATKWEISDAIADQYGVRPLMVRTVNVRGKARRRGRTSGSTAAFKKAYVKMEDIQSLNLAP